MRTTVRALVRRVRQWAWEELNLRPHAYQAWRGKAFRESCETYEGENGGSSFRGETKRPRNRAPQRRQNVDRESVFGNGCDTAAGATRAGVLCTIGDNPRDEHRERARVFRQPRATVRGASTHVLLAAGWWVL